MYLSGMGEIVYACYVGKYSDWESARPLTVRTVYAGKQYRATFHYNFKLLPWLRINSAYNLSLGVSLELTIFLYE